MVMRRINRRIFAYGMAFAPMLRSVWAQDAHDYVGQYLTATKINTRVLGNEGPTTEHWTFKTNSTLPIIWAKQGQELRLRLSNELDEAVSLHFFGVRGAADMMTVIVQPGPSNSVEVVFTPPDAGTFWFGPLLNASKHREMGLSGILIVQGSEPQSYYDVPLILDDWLIGDDGKIEADFANLDRASGEGRLGNWFTVNGEFKPNIKLPVDRIARLRLLNVANSRSMNIALKGAVAVVVALNGQPILPAPLGLKTLVLEPGQTADVILSEAQEQVTVALDLFEDVVELAFLDAAGYRRSITAVAALRPNPVSILDPAILPRDIAIAIEGGQRGGLKSARVGKDVLDLRAMLEQGLAWSIGGNAGLGAPPLFDAKFGEVLRLNIENKTIFSQPLYIHGHVWLDTTLMPTTLIGPQLPPVWSDSIVVEAKATAQVLLVTANAGTWAIQSLLAERCDAGLIGAFTVADMP
jgi:FtsP/CotA-like multicopper oxidase with cupredoxin domain